jgi:hypothetical protein
VTYRIQVKGRLGAHWAAWFDGLTITPVEDGTTVIEGSLVDQAALHGVLQKLRDLGLSLESVAHTSTPSTTDDLTGEPT